MQGRVLVDRSSEANTEASKYYEVNPADPKIYIERTHKEVHCPPLTSRLDDHVLAPSSPLKNGIVSTVDPVNASTRQNEQSNIPHSLNELQTGIVLQRHGINEKTACVENQSVPQVR